MNAQLIRTQSEREATLALVAIIIKLGFVVATRNSPSAHLGPGSVSLNVQILAAIIVSALATFRL